MNKRLFIPILFLLFLVPFCINANKKISPVPKTGDDTNIIIWIALAAVSLILFVVLIISSYSKRKNKYSLSKKDEKKEEKSGSKKIIFKAEDYE